MSKHEYLNPFLEGLDPKGRCEILCEVSSMAQQVVMNQGASTEWMQTQLSKFDDDMRDRVMGAWGAWLSQSVETKEG